MRKTTNPLVSIGIPTYNRPDTLKKVVTSLMNQSYENIEIIISDNASEAPGMSAIVKDILASDKDGKVRYYRQSENIGAALNYKYVLDKANGEYFMWNADDDLRSLDFISSNTQFLERNTDYAASTSPNALVQNFQERVSHYVDFGLEGSKLERFKTFFDNAMISHGILYSLFRTEIIRECPYLGKNFIAVDWAISLYVITQGPLARIEDGYILNLRGGVSESTSHFKNYRHNWVDDINPMCRFYDETKDLYRDFTFRERIFFFKRVMKFNSIYYTGLFGKLKRSIRTMVKRNLGNQVRVS